MKSVVIQQPNELVIEERPLPAPVAGEVRVKIKLAGICGSDSHIYRGHNPFAKYPRVIGHEFFGVIDAVGEGLMPHVLDSACRLIRSSAAVTAIRAQSVNQTSVPRWWCWAFTVTAASVSTPWYRQKMRGLFPMPSPINMP
jgi:hypothetical protein